MVHVTSVSGMVESVVDRCQRALEHNKEYDGLRMQKYNTIAEQVGIDSLVADKEAAIFDENMRSKVLQTLSENINTR